MQKANPIEMPQKYKKLLSILRPGAEQAITAGEIEQITGIDTRSVGSITAELVKDYGLLIGASRSKPFGYYIIENEAELKATLRSLNNEAQQTMQRHKALYLNFYKE